MTRKTRPPSCTIFFRVPGIIFGDYSEQWKQQRHVSMTTLRELGYGRNRLQEIIAEETDVLCGILAEKKQEELDLCELLK